MNLIVQGMGVSQRQTYLCSRCLIEKKTLGLNFNQLYVSKDDDFCTVIIRKLAHAINRYFLAFEIENFQLKNFDIFLIFAQHIDNLWVLVRTAVLMSTHNICFGAKIRKIGIPLHTSVFFYIKVGFKGVYITQTFFLMVTDCSDFEYHVKIEKFIWPCPLLFSETSSTN